MALPVLGYTPEEQAADDKYEAARAPQNLTDLDAELKRTKDPKARAVLEAERARITGAKPAPKPAAAAAKPASRPADDEWFPVLQTRKKLGGKLGSPEWVREAFINGQWIRVEETGKKAEKGKVVPYARLGKYGPSWEESFLAGAEKHLGGLPYEIGKSIAAYRSGPGGGKALEEGERAELGSKYPRVVGTPAERSMPFVAGGAVGGAATDPLTFLGARAGPMGMVGMGGLSAGGASVSEGLRAGRVSPSEVGVSTVVGGATGGVVGLLGPWAVRTTAKGAKKLIDFMTGKQAMPEVERQKLLAEILKKHAPPGTQEELILTDEQIDKVNAELDAASKRFGVVGAPSKPIAKPAVKAASKDKTIQTGPIVEASEGDLEQVLPFGGKKVEPKVVGELPEPPKPEFRPISALPRDLAGAKPRYSYGEHQFEVEFESDIDKAAYITAQKTRSARDADYVEFVKQATGMSESEVRAYGAQVRERIKQEAVFAITNKKAGEAPKPLVIGTGKREPSGVPGEEGPVKMVGLDKPLKTAKIDYNKDSLLTAITKLGGLSREHWLDLVGEDVKARMPKETQGAFQVKGKSFDEIRELLVDEGYIPPEFVREDGGIQWLQEAIRDEASGQYKHFSLKADENVLFSRLRDQQGGIATQLLIHMGSTAGGAVAGAKLDPEHPVRGAIVGGAAGLAVPALARRLVAGGPATMLTVLGKRDPLLAKIASEPVAKAEGAIAAKARETVQIVSRFKGYNIPIADQELIVHAIQAGRVQMLPANLQPIASEFTTLVGRLGMQGQQAGVVPNLGRNYVPQIWDTADPTTKRVLERLGYAIDKDAGREGFSIFTPFALPKHIQSYVHGVQALQLKPKSYDLGDLYGMYASSVNRAVENAKALSMVRQLKDNNGRELVSVAGQSPRGYVKLKNVPDMDAYVVHPEIAEGLERALGSHDLNRIERGLLSVSFTAKRMNTMYSLFHPKSLLEASTLAGGNPLGFIGGALARGAEKLSGKTIGFESAEDLALKAYHTGGAGDSVDFLIRNGLEIKPPIEDVSALGAYQKMVSDIPLIGPAATKTDQALQTFTWKYTQTGMKLATGMRLFEREVLKHPNADPNKIAADVSKFVNRTFGGLNWRREVEDVQNKWLHKYAATATNERGMAWQQIMMFAPDWKYSTFLSWAKAVPGVEPSKLTQELHQKYVATAVAAQLVVNNALNKRLSGHYSWENAKYRPEETMSVKGMLHEPTWHDVYEGMLYVDLGDGRRLNTMKHASEVEHLAADPAQFALNALGYLPRTVGESLLNKQWLSSTYAPDIAKDPKSLSGYAQRFLFHPIERVAPFQAQQMFDQGPASVGGFLGFPITGMKGEERMNKRLEDKLERFKE